LNKNIESLLKTAILKKGTSFALPIFVSLLTKTQSPNMNWKKYWLASAAVLVVAKGMVAFLFFAVVLNFFYDKPFPGARPEGEELYAVEIVCMVAWTLGFSFIYTRLRQNNEWKDGLKFGILVWFFYFVPMITGVWAYFQVPVNWVIAGLVSGLAESLTAGLLVGLIYKPKNISL
jgi:hypothetical protein